MVLGQRGTLFCTVAAVDAAALANEKMRERIRKETIVEPQLNTRGKHVADD
jgi:hypothetical protein